MGGFRAGFQARFERFEWFSKKTAQTAQTAQILLKNRSNRSYLERFLTGISIQAGCKFRLSSTSFYYATDKIPLVLSSTGRPRLNSNHNPYWDSLVGKYILLYFLIVTFFDAQSRKSFFLIAKVLKKKMELN